MRLHYGNSTLGGARGRQFQFLIWVAGAKFFVGRLRHDLERKGGFDPGQPRDAQGRWTDGSRGGDGGGIGAPLGPDAGEADIGNSELGDINLGDFDRGDLDFGDGGGDTSRSVEPDPTGEAPWSTVVSDRRTDGSLAQEMVFNRDGSTIHSEYAKPNDNLGWDERHTVVATGGDRIRFATSGDTQTITDANTGGVLGRSTWGERGPEPDATL